MESNKDKATKAIHMAERKIKENDYVRAKELVNKAQNLYPKLDGLKQVSMMIDVYISASTKVNREGEADWYGVLCVDPLANDEALKKQYKKLALLLHPDKNKFTGATEVFKLVSQAWCLLSDKAKRISYDQKRKLFKHKTSGTQQKRPKRHESDFSWPKPKPESKSKSKSKYEYEYENEHENEHEYEHENEHEYEYEYEHEPKTKREPEPDYSWKYKDFGTFWTKCDKCDTYCEFGRYSYLNKTVPCPNCRQDFVATETVVEMINGRPFIRFSNFRASTFSSSTSASASAKAAEERMRGWFESDFSSEKDKVDT